MTQGSSEDTGPVDPAIFPDAANAYARVWEHSCNQLREWLLAERFPCQLIEAADVFEEVHARLAKDNWAACLAEHVGAHQKRSRRPVSSSITPLQGDTATKHLMVAYRRIVRAIEIRKWSQLILGDDSVRPGPLGLPQHWRARLPSIWSADSPHSTQSIQEAMAELARAGWAALGNYGMHRDPGQWFLEQLLARLQWRGTWDGLLNSSLCADGLPLTEAFRIQTTREFSSPADADRAFHWAINHLVEKKFKAPGIRPVHEVSNPQAFLRASFARALNDFRRQAWSLGQLQRPRPEKWMRHLGEDWVTIFNLVVKHASPEDVVQRFLAEDSPMNGSDGPLAEESLLDTSDDVSGEQATDKIMRNARPFLALATQIDQLHRGNPIARVRAIDALLRNYLEHVKKWQRPAAAQSLSAVGDDGEEYDLALPAATNDPLMELLCDESRRRLRDADADAMPDDWSPERRIIRTLLGPGFSLTDDEALLLRDIVNPPPRKAGRPRKDADMTKQHLLARLRSALHEAGIDVSILDFLSVKWNDDDASFPPGGTPPRGNRQP
ncbi:hypothetical protein OS176_02440 [Xanthomonadaceae bacterium XH05]|nr:hypothetical protein [Xanthomonadaceae bacterium XH05]